MGARCGCLTHMYTHTHKAHRYRERTGLPQAGVWVGVKWVEVVQRYKLPIINLKSHGDIMYSMATTVGNILLHI